MGKKKESGNLGRSLIKDRFGHKKDRRTVDNNSMLHTQEVQDGYDWGRLNLQSVTEESSFQEFLRTAELAGTEFQAEKLNISFVNPKSNVGLLTTAEKKEAEKKHLDKKELLKIPRRPKWDETTKKEELVARENESFLEWRRGLALLQEDEGILMTPYEKNLEFWRQLWRVVERSDVVVQIVDARNPLLFRSEDLERYVKEVGSEKMNLILANKADFLTDEQRQHWAKYFTELGIRVVFFSALDAKEDLLKDIKEEEDSDTQDNSDSDSEEEADVEKKVVQKKSVTNDISLNELKEAAEKLSQSVQHIETQLEKLEEVIGSDALLNDPNVLTREQLILLFKIIHKGKKVTEGITTIGLVGYPNVGKSSTINALMIEKKVSVSATPGKTKHFQTLYLDTDLLLCDCPGLVMPSFVLTKADMILNGILPIDQMRDHVPPVNLLCTLVPRHILEDKYGVMIAKPLEGEDPNRPPYSEELLLAYGYNRGFMTSNGQPDQSRSARYVLKDYVNGKLLFAYAPPNVDQEIYHIHPKRVRPDFEEKNLPQVQQRAMRIKNKTTTKDLDDQFFEKNRHGVHIKGQSFSHIRIGADGRPVEGGSTSASSLNLAGAGEKPWRTAKREKREKLRKRFSHLDQH